MINKQTFGTASRLRNNEILTFDREIELAIETEGEQPFFLHREKMMITTDSQLNKLTE